MKKLKEESFYLNKEFNYIITDIINNEEFQKLKKVTHHGITRFNHSLRVSYYTFLISKRLKLNYVDATRAALLHDFFIDETSEMKTKKALKEHPKFALENSKKYFDISRMQEDIILKHMYPITTKMPKYKESWLVDIVDDIASLYEKTYSVNKEVKTAINFIFIMLFIRFR